MKKVPLKELKINLSFWAEEASKGNRIEVTKNNKPYILLVPNQKPGVHYGKYSGKKTLKTVTHYRGKREWLKYLLEDRGES